jgi:hypothetical protein
MELREKEGIRSCIGHWPGKSPDLNMIEPCWSDLKDECHPRFDIVRGTGAAAKAEVRDIAASSWRAIEAGCRNHATRFLGRLRDVEQRGGNNNVRG